MKNKDYSIPDFIRPGLSEVSVEVKSQDFGQTEPDKSASEAAVQLPMSEKPASVGCFGAISEKAVISICSDMRAFLQGRGFGDRILCKDGNLIASAATVALPVSELKKKLMTMGFKRWQVVSTEHENQVRVVILYADVTENTRTIITEMESMGWDKVSISEPAAIHGVKCRTMDFEPSPQRD